MIRCYDGIDWTREQYSQTKHAEQNDKEQRERELNLKQAQIMDKSRQFDERIQSQEEQTAARIQAALEREMLKQRSVE